MMFRSGALTRAALAAASLFFAAACLSAQTSPPSVPAQNPPAASPQTNAPEPYAGDEFPDWARDLWRAEVIFVGSFPFSIFFTLEGYDLVKYAANGFRSTPTTPAPWPFTSATDIKYTPDEQLWLIVTAATISLLIATADYLIGRFMEANAKR